MSEGQLQQETPRSKGTKHTSLISQVGWGVYFPRKAKETTLPPHYLYQAISYNLHDITYDGF